jgi:hypothetical protein
MEVAIRQREGTRNYLAQGLGNMALGYPETIAGTLTTAFAPPAILATEQSSSLYIRAGGRAGLEVSPWWTILGEAYVSTKLAPGLLPAAESKLIPRLGPKGVDPLHHNANVLVRDVNGNVVSHQRFVSGNMTLEEQMLPFPRNTLASHTEARAVRTTPLERGQSMTITGRNPPCPSCKGAMNATATETGATIRYQWRQDGRTMIWVAKPKGQ